MAIKTIVILILLYLAIGVLVHNYTEPRLRKKRFRSYSRHDKMIWFLDVFLWFPFTLVAIYKKIIE